MSSNNPKHHRRSIRLPEYDYSSPGAYFVTMCVQDRLCLLGNIENDIMGLSEYGESVKRWWSKIPERFPGVLLDEYIIMPNHMHGIIVITERLAGAIPVGAIHESPLRGTSDNESQMRKTQRRRMLLPMVIGYFKMNSAKHINRMRGTTGHRFWQRDYWEHIGRDEQALNKIREYIRNNPFYWTADEENPTGR